jgi:glucose-6-phosphate 1-dehydrogenase
LDDVSIMQEKLKIFKELKLAKDFHNHIVFWQYEWYLEETWIPKDSRTETFVALKMEVCNWRFIGVPIYLKTWKYLDKKSTKIVIEFKDIPNLLFRKYWHIERNRIILEVQPDETISIHFNIKQDGESQKVERVRSVFNKELASKEAYEKLLEDVIIWDKTLFTSFEMLKQSWTIVDDLINCHDNCPLIHKYEKWTRWPIESDNLLHRDWRKWYC